MRSAGSSLRQPASAGSTRLERAVAIKVLPDAVSHDADRRARFESEARSLAALNHPHIGAIYGVEDSGDMVALVLELVEGPTLAERLSLGPLRFDEVVSTGRQIAEALEAAHDRGIVHRDLKPANVKITPDGTVKVLDFGLAKAMGSSSPMSATDDAAVAPSVTRVGTIVGTAAYMSPEQARGQPVDKRTDIWAFGCVMFELCTGRPPFVGATVKETLAAVLEQEPDWALLPSNTPAYLAGLLRRCLTSNQKLRLRDIGEARIALAHGGDTGDAGAPMAHAGRRWAMAVVTAAVMLAVLTGAGLYALRPPLPVPAASPVRFLVAPPGNGFVHHSARTFLAVSPDGSQLAFVAGTDRFRVWLRAMADLEARPVPGTEDATSVFWAPDSRSLAFFAAGKLKRVDLPGGAAVTIADVPASGSMHGTWGASGVILLGLSYGTAISTVPAAGGSPRDILTPNRSSGERRVHWPWFLPDGRRFLYTVRLEDGDGELRVGDLDGASRTVMRLSSNTQWVDPDIVVFVREGVLMGQRVDLEAAQPVGQPFSIAEPVDYLLTTSRGMFSASRQGTIAYHPGQDVSKLVWADQQGNELGVVGPPADYEIQSPRLSSNGSALLFSRRQPGLGTFDIFRVDLVRQTEERLTTERGSELTPVGTDAGRGIVFAADRGGVVSSLFRRDLASGTEQPLLAAGMQQLPMDVFPDGRTLAYLQRSSQGAFDIFQVSLNTGAEPIPLVVSRADKYDMRLSPDGRAMAFIASDGTRLDLYVAPLPVSTAPVLAADAVGSAARWSADGRRLYYLDDTNRMMSIAVRTRPTLEVGTPQPLFQLKQRSLLADVARDGRFLLLVSITRAGQRPITVATAAIPTP